MAGMMALMGKSRRERERKRNTSLHDETGFSEVMYCCATFFRIQKKLCFPANKISLDSAGILGVFDVFYIIELEMPAVAAVSSFLKRKRPVPAKLGKFNFSLKDLNPFRRRRKKKSEKQKLAEKYANLRHVSNVVIKAFPKYPPKWVIPGKDGAPLGTPESKTKKSPVSIPKTISRQQSLNAIVQKNSKLDPSRGGPFAAGLRQSYTSVYIGLVLVAIGLVISFVGLGEKGFQTLELKLIGPILCMIGFLCIFFKVLQCAFPRLMRCPRWLKRARLNDSDKANLMEKGRQNGHLGNSRSNSEGLSPRITLQSSRKSPRPHSTIPNYIEDSSEDDDFDAGRARPHSNRNNSLEPKNEILLTPANLVL